MKRLLVTAGPTHEAIDAVRYIANRSSGRMGVALAQAAKDAGWEVTLLLGPVCDAAIDGLQVERFTSAEDLRCLLDEHFPECDVLIMAAAVADYTPANKHVGKLARQGDGLVLKLVPTPDLVAGCAARRQPHQRVIGFALEERGRLDKRAIEKLRSKNLDAIVANPLETMGSESISARVLTSDGTIHVAPSPVSNSKKEFASWLIPWIEHTLF